MTESDHPWNEEEAPLDEPFAEDDYDLEEDEPTDAEADAEATSITVEEAEDGYDADLDDPEDDATGYENEG